MKIVGIDVPRLQSRRAELQAEIEQIDGILRIADAGEMSYIGVEVRETNGKFHSYQQGNRKQILLGLLAAGGSAHVEVLAKALGWTIADCAVVARGAIRDGFILEYPDRFELTDMGTTAANWFRRNPQYKTYRNPAVSQAEARRRKQLGE